MPAPYKKVFLKETEEQILKMTREELVEGLTERERRFCETYVKSFNIKMAAVQAGFKPSSAHVSGYKLRQRYDINLYIAWLKLRISKDCHVSAMDYLDQYIRIAFADMTDFVTVKNGRAKVHDSEMIDGQLIKSLKQTKDGVAVELYDKMAAMDKLIQYMDVMPADWKQRIEERKVQLLEEKLKLEQIKLGQIQDDSHDDGFMQALMQSAESVWDGEVNVEVGDEDEHEIPHSRRESR